MDQTIPSNFEKGVSSTALLMKFPSQNKKTSLTSRCVSHFMPVDVTWKYQTVVLTQHCMTVVQVNIVRNKCTDSTDDDVVGEGRQVEVVRLTLLTTQLRTSNLPFYPPFANEVRIVFPRGDHHNRK